VYPKVMLIPISTVGFQPSLWYGAYEATAGCEVEMFRSGVLLAEECQLPGSSTSEKCSVPNDLLCANQGQENQECPDMLE